MKEEEIYQAAKRLPAGSERETFLASACDNDPELWRRVADRLIGGTVPGIGAGGAGVSVGTVIDRYRLAEQIGQGGMGSVWRAEQDKPVKRSVALKIIKLGMDTEEVVARFDRERQALALMNHPYIAKVFDAGATKQGRPFFVMELVAGLPISQFCDEQKLSVAARLRLFVEVCGAVQHAHQKGIIHRDIKPTNVLVSATENGPAPRIIDFGIAKAVDPTSHGQTYVTAANSFVGTPAYMSPEQANPGEGGVDTRTDIYSLGVMLYELLTSRLPLEREQSELDSVTAYRKVICEVEPEWPSTRVSKLTSTAREVVAETRSTGLENLRRSLSGDLDWIVMKAMEKDPARRYEAASSLAHDIQRYLNYEPVAARPPSAIYRLQKTVRRNRVAFSAGLVVFLALTLGLGTALKMYFGEAAANTRAMSAEAGQFRLRVAAERAQGAAEENARISREQAIETRRFRYAADMAAAQIAFERGNLALVKQLAEEYLPRPGVEDLRGFEWYHWWTLAKGEQTETLKHHKAPASAIAWSRDGLILASGDTSGFICITDGRSGKLLRSWQGHAGEIVSLSFSEGDRLLASGGKDTKLKIWVTKDYTALREIVWASPRAEFAPTGNLLAVATGGDLWGQTGLPQNYCDLYLVDATTGEIARKVEHAAHRVTWSPDGRHLLAAHKRNAVTVLDASTGQEVAAQENVHNIQSLAFSPDGALAAVGTRWGVLLFWDWRQNKAHSVRGSDQFFISDLSFSPDGKRLAAAMQKRITEIWNVAEAKLETKLLGQPAEVRAVDFNPVDQQLATAALDRTVCLWNVSGRKDYGRSSTPIVGVMDQRFWDKSDAPRYAPDGKTLLVAMKTGAVEAWDVESLTRKFVLPDAGYPVLFDPNDGVIVTRNGDFSKMERWNPVSGKRVGSVAINADLDKPTCLRISVDRRTIVLGHDGRISLLDATSQAVDLAIAIEGQPNAVDLSPDRTKVVAVVGDRAGVWNVATGEKLCELVGHEQSVTQVLFFPDSKRILTSSWDSSARVWSAETGVEIGRLIGHLTGVHWAALSPDGVTALTVSDDKTVRLWNTRTYRQVYQLVEYNLWYPVFSPQGDQLITLTDANDSLAIWNVRSK